MHKYLYGFLVLVMVITPLAMAQAKMVREQTLTRTAEANFLTNHGCEDVSVGANVTNNTLSVFGSFVDNCEFGNSSSFFGTTTVATSEFIQDGVNGASLNKTFNIDTNETTLNLVWEGVGPIGGEDFQIHTKKPNVKKSQEVDSRNATMTGVFIVNGLNRIDDSSLVNAQLEVIKTDTKTVSK